MALSTTEQLEALVLLIEANPGNLIRPSEFAGIDETLDLDSVLSQLPDGLRREELVGILKLALLTECATESYAAVFLECAKTHNASWLGRFTERVWAPDELTHYVPYKLLLMKLGLSEAELDREIEETQARQYVHSGGKSPLRLTTFGMIQECLTDGWHGLIANLLAKGAPEAALLVRRVKRRETLHAVWYRNMTAIQLQASPHLIGEVAGEISTFAMPGTSLLPEFQAQASEWQGLMGGDAEVIFRDLVRYVAEALGDVGLLGKLGLTVALANTNLTSRPVRLVTQGLLALGQPCHRLVGEAILSKTQLSYIAKREAAAPENPGHWTTSIPARMRIAARSSLATLMPSASQFMLKT